MKKILLLILLFSLSAVNLFAQIKEIRGNQNVYTNEPWIYIIEFDAPLAQDTRFIIRLGKYGTFTNSADTARSELIKKGKTRFDFHVKWGNIETNNAQIIAYKAEVNPQNVKKLNVKISKKPTTPPSQVNGKLQITGPDYVQFGEIAEYKASYHGANGAAIKFQVNKNVFEIIEIDYGWYNPNLPNIYTTFITLKAKQNTHARYEISAESYFYHPLENKEYINTGYKDILVHPKHALKLNSQSIICTNNNASYEIEPAIGTGTVNWLSDTNMSLVSGQGTSTATYKASGNKNDYNPVKAVIRYDKVDYPVENSQVWVGAPIAPQIGTRLLGGEILSDTTYFTIANLPQKSFWGAYNVGGFDGSGFLWTTDFNTTPGQVINRPVNQRLIIPEHPLETGLYITTSNATYARTNYTSEIDPRTGLPLPARSADLYYWAENRCGWSQNPTYFRINFKNPPILKSQVEVLKPLTIDPSSPVSIKIHSFSSGELVYQNKKAINFNINETNLKKGIYIVTTTDDKGNITQDKIMKTND